MELISVFLVAHGADRIEHPGGTLFEHLGRTARRLESWGARPALVAAGFCHAAYGTDGFPRSLVDIDRRADLTRLIGPEAEGLVYVYACCDRAYGLPTPDKRGRTDMRDRFTRNVFVPRDDVLRSIVELTCANEIDVLLQSPGLSASARREISRILLECRPLASARASSAIDDAIRGCAKGDL
jgi:hypothetical protein